MWKVAIAAVLLSAGAVNAQSCAPRDAMIEGLATKFGEHPVSRGINGRGAMIEMLANQETGTWTAIVTAPDGQSCVAASGEAFTLLTEEAPTGERI